MNAKKILVALLAVVLIIGCTIGGTLAWLSAQSGTVKNTFTVGDINITLQEHELKADGTLDTTKEVTENKNYKVVPGGKQPKDPFVTVEAKSENCYVYVNVVNNLTIDSAVVVAYNINATTTDWEQVATKTNTDGTISTLYRYKAVVAYSETADQDLPVFTEVSYSENILKDVSDDVLKIGQLEGKTIELTAYAHQSANTTRDDADAAAKTLFNY